MAAQDSIPILPAQPSTHQGNAITDLLRAVELRLVKPLTTAELARGYQNGYFLMRGLSPKAVTHEDWQFMVRVADYCAHRYQEVLLIHPGLCPRPWRASSRGGA